MKPFWIAAVLAAPLASTCTCARAQDSAPSSAVLANADFEGVFKAVRSQSDSSNAKARISGEVAEGWNDNSDWAPVTIRYSRDAANPHRGASSQRIEVGRVDGGAVQFVHPVSVQKGRVYEARVWLRGQSGQSVSVSLRRAGAPYNEYAGQSIALSPEWKEVSVLAPVGEDAEAFVMIRATSSQVFWVDDAALVDVSDAASIGAPIVGNQLSNGSFETSRLPLGWSVRFEGAQDFRTRDPRPTLDSSAAVGRQSLRAEIPAGGNVAITSPLVQPNYARPHSASVWLKSSRADTPVQLRLENTDLQSDVRVGTRWQRFSFGGTLPFRRWTQLRISVPTQEATTSLWIDGASLEEGAGSESYAPAAPLEMTLSLDAVGHVVFDKEKPQVLVSVAASATGASANRGARLARSVEDLNGRIEKLPAIALPTASPRTSFALPAMGARRGMWKMRAQALARDGRPLSKPVEMIWARLPRPRILAPEKSYFGLHVPLSERYVRLGLAVGSKWTRLHDTSMVGKWALAEPQPGDYKYFDDGVSLTRRLGMQILGMMDGAPRWAATKPREGYWGIWHIPDAPGALDSWERYCGRMAEHYRGRIDFWEVWNEPWGEWFLGAGGQPDLYAELLTRAHRALNRFNPGGTLIGVDTYAGYDEKWTIPVLTKSGTDNFDVLSFHEYNDALFGGPNSIPVQRARTFHALLEKHGASKPLWNTEGGLFGVASWYSPVTGGMAPAAQGAYIVRYDVAMMGAGVQKSFLYALHSDTPMGGMETRTTEVGDVIKPILGARAVLASLVDGAGTPRRDEPAPGIDRYVFSNGVQVLWSFDGADHTLEVPAKMRALDGWGNAVRGSRGVKVGIEPVYFVRR